METVTITLDGMQVTGLSTSTVLDLARDAGAEVPTLCHEAGLSPTGSCHLCVVEDEATGQLLVSCDTHIRAGMSIRTGSPIVIARRKKIVEDMLRNHPESCSACGENGVCQLRKIAASLGVERPPVHASSAGPEFEAFTPFIQRDRSKCIACAKCVRVDRELVAQGSFDRTQPSPIEVLGNELQLDGAQCTLCGTCIAHCPVGALSEVERPGHAKAETTVDTTCPFCGCGCGIRLGAKDNVLVSATPLETSPVNHGALCIRGSYGYEFVNDPERLTHPLMKTADGFKRITWEKALAKVASCLKKLTDAHGADSVSVLGSPRCTNEENYVLQRFAREVLGTNNVDNSGNMYVSASIVGLGRTVGFPGSTSSIAGMEKPSVIVLLGADPDSCTPAVGYAIRRAVRSSGATLIIIDPRQIKLSALATLHLRPRLGTDVELLNALARAVVDAGLYDRESVDCSTEKFQEMLLHLQACNVKDASNITGVSSDDINLAGNLIASAEEVSIVIGDGICRQPAASDSVTALANLALLTGNTGQPRGGLFALRQESNAQGACDMGAVPRFLPGFVGVEDEQARRAFEQRWGSPLSGNPGLTSLQMIEEAKRGRLKAMLVFGENPMDALPNPDSTREALASLDLLVVADMFLSETAKLATIVLPAASFAEKDGTFTNFEGRVQPVRRAISGRGESLPDFEIVLRLAEQMGRKMPYAKPSHAMDEIRELVPSYGGTAYADSDSESSEPELLSTTRFTGPMRHYGGLFPTGFARFWPVQYHAATRSSSVEFPLTLLTGTTLARLGTGTRTSRSTLLKKFAPHSWIEVGPGDAQEFGLEDGDKVRVVSSLGDITTVLKVTSGLPPKTVFMPRAFSDAPVNHLFETFIDEQGTTVSTGDCLVRLERTGVPAPHKGTQEARASTIPGRQPGSTTKGGQRRPMVKEVPVIWLQTSACTGCSVSLLESASPNVKNLLVDQVVPGTHISLRFHATLMGGSGEQALQVIEETMAKEQGDYVLVVEGAIPTSPDGVFGFIGERGGHPFGMKERVLELAANSMAVMSVGTCAAFGGIPAAEPNPTGCRPVRSVLDGAGIAKPLINIPGCPPHPDWVVNTIAGILLRGLPKADELDDNLRPLAFYGKLIHETCPRRASFDEGKFAKKPGDEGCLYQLGCKGPITYADCPTRRWNSGTNWVIGAGAPCNGCTQPEFPDLTSPFYEKLPETLFRTPALIQR